MLTIILQKSLADIDLIPVFWTIICLLFTGLIALLIYFWNDYKDRDTAHKGAIEKLLGDHHARLTELEHFKISLEALASAQFPGFYSRGPIVPPVAPPPMSPSVAANVLPLILTAHALINLFPQVQ